VSMAKAAIPAGALELHTGRYGGSARLLFVWSSVCVCLLVPWLTADFIRTGDQGDKTLLSLLGLFCVVSFFQLRQRPKIYGSESGLDLEWAWGKRLHLPWAEVHDVRQLAFPPFGGARFRLGLSRGSIRFYACPDFAEKIYRLKLTLPTH